MDARTKRTVLSVAWVTLSALQVAYGLGQRDLAFAGVGVVFGALAVAYFWAEVYRQPA